MSKKREARQRRQVIPVWTYEQAHKALPYIASIMRTVREQRIEALSQDRQAHRLANRPGRPDRTALIARQETLRNGQLADDRFQDAVGELQEMGIFCLDPIRGQGLIPFLHDDQLAWFVYDQFEPEVLRFWRYHNDDLDKRRPIAEVQTGPAADSVIV